MDVSNLIAARLAAAGGPAAGTGGAAAQAPRTVAEAQQLAASFRQEMQTAASSIATAGDQDSDGGDGEQDGFTMPELPPDAATLQAKYGAGSTRSLAALTSPAGQVGAGTSLLNAPVTSAGPVSAGAGENAKVVAGVAAQRGVDPTLAVAMMLVESGGNASAVGDGGSSFGLFQLHRGGMLTAAGLTPDQAFDPATNAGVALSSLARESARGGDRTPGQVAAASQRPADQVGYAAKVDAAMARARALLGMPA